MARILALDYGNKRTGIAVTDPMKIIATGLTTVDTQKLFEFLKDYVAKEPVERILIGEPYQLDGTPTHSTEGAKHCIRRLKNSFPEIPIETVDESHSSKMASRAMVEMGMIP
ncbi:MAG: Holliday junction resolvase RuvX [Chitinophagaceae bacterium]|nr:Holliday junction resolvase RuvX [Chitinophagaceae bacterium]